MTKKNNTKPHTSIIDKDLLEEKNLASLRDMAKGIVHDFNNILTAILGNVTLAKMEVNAQDEIYESISEIERASLQARDLTQQLSYFSGRRAIFEKAASIVSILESAGNNSNAKCEIHIPDDIWPIEIDVAQFSLAINNIVMNANEAMAEKGIIRIKVQNAALTTNDDSSSTNKYVMISVQDEGEGIPNEYLPKIYNPYFSTKQKARGLGLSIAYSIINFHKGYITVETETGVGSTFSVYLPAL